MKRFLNLTNGLLWLDPRENLRFLDREFDGVVRIQSTHLEQGHWSKLIEDLDYNFLLPLVVGEKTVVYDATHRNSVGASPRAIFQGLPWIRYVLNTRVRNLSDSQESVRGHDCTTYFATQNRNLSQAARSKLSYVRKFGEGQRDPVQLEGFSLFTDRDGHYDYFVKLYQDHLNHAHI